MSSIVFRAWVAWVERYRIDAAHHRGHFRFNRPGSSSAARPKFTDLEEELSMGRSTAFISAVSRGITEACRYAPDRFSASSHDLPQPRRPRRPVDGIHTRWWSIALPGRAINAEAGRRSAQGAAEFGDFSCHRCRLPPRPVEPRTTPSILGRLAPGSQEPHRTPTAVALVRFRL